VGIRAREVFRAREIYDAQKRDLIAQLENSGSEPKRRVMLQKLYVSYEELCGPL
jgi:hypothetical protein